MIARFLRWWLAELSAVLAAGRPAAARRGDTLRFDVDEERVAVAHLRNGREQEIGRVLRGGSDDDPARESLAALLAGFGPDTTFCELRLAPGLVLVKEMVLPAAAAENLRQVLGFEMDRQTPFRAEDVYFGHAVLGREDNGRKLRVRVAVVPRAVADEALGLLGAWGLDPADGGLALADDGGAVTIGFRAAGYRSGGSGRWTVALAALNVALLVVAVAIPIHQQRRQLQVLDEALADTRERAQAAAEVESEVRALETGLRHLNEQRAGRPSMVEVLEELSVRLPDSTWLFRLEIRDGTAHLQGSSSAASSLIAILEESPLFSGVRFASPVVREGNTGRDRFHISADVVPAGAEPAAPVAHAVGRGRRSG